MEYRKVKVKDIKANDYNPNEMTEDLFEALKKEISEKGFLMPVLLNTDNTIIDGEHRWKAAWDIGLEEIPAIIKEMTPEEAKIGTINMNQIKGNLNPIKMAKLLEDLKTTFSLDELSSKIFMDNSELESYDMLNDLPDLDMSLLEKEAKLIKCPECGHNFER